MDSHKRSWAKALTWRATATTITTVLVLWRSGHINLALEVGALDIVFKLFAYWGHERLWIWLGKTDMLQKMRDKVGKYITSTTLAYLLLVMLAILTAIVLNYAKVIDLSKAYLWF